MDETKQKNISEQIISDIVQKCCKGFDSVAGMAKPVRVSLTRKDSVIDIYINVYIGCRIPDTAWNMQEAVRKAVEEQADVNVKKVNINILGVTDKETKI